MRHFHQTLTGSTFPSCKDCGEMLKAPYVFRSGVGYLHWGCLKADPETEDKDG